jgi:hypothetical protein
MTFHELNQIINIPKSESKIKTNACYGSGQSHPLWDCFNAHLNPPFEWKSLTGVEKTQIIRAAKVLDENNIPYCFYIKYIKRTGKYHMVRNPLMVTKYKETKSGPTILGEYINLMTYLKKVFIENPDILVINDYVYKVIPNATTQIFKYAYTVDIIKDSLNSRSKNEILQILNNSPDIHSFWNQLGKIPQVIDIDVEGKDKSSIVRMLQKEIRIRLGKDLGVPNKSLNKYFCKNRLNKKGLEIIA